MALQIFCTSSSACSGRVLVLEGFDFGRRHAALVHRRNDLEERLLLNTIGRSGTRTRCG